MLSRFAPRLRTLLPLFLRPPALLGLLVLGTGALSLLFAPSFRAGVTSVQVDLAEGPAEVLEAEEVGLIVSDANHLPRTVSTVLALPQEEARRLELILAGLRDYLAEARPESPGGPLWPDTLSAPRVFIVEAGDRSRDVVLDFYLPAGSLEAPVAQELRLLASVRRTVRLHMGDSGVHFLVNGQPRPTLLGHVALDSALD